MTHVAIQATFPHTCAHPRRLCRICRWVEDRETGVTLITNLPVPLLRGKHYRTTAEPTPTPAPWTRFDGPRNGEH